MQYPDLARTLIRLKDADLALRTQLLREGKLNDGYHPEMAAVHDRNARETDKIIMQIGYPTTEKVGRKGSLAAWLIIQHAVGQPDLMRKCAALLTEAVNAGQADPQSLAYLTDRIAVFESKPQLYGTAFDYDENGALNPLPYDDLILVNQRRRAVGLLSLEEQTALLRRRAEEEGEKPPADFAAKQAAYEKWRREVGWLGE